MKILHLSDTHGMHRRLINLPEADVLVHSGDFSMIETEEEILDFLNWFCDLPYTHKIYICGNHEILLYESNVEGLDANVHYLHNSAVTIDGVKFYGVSMFQQDASNGMQDKFYSEIPMDTDVLVTHVAPYGILDTDYDGSSQGDLILSKRISEMRNLKAHLFGHFHSQHGIMHDDGGVLFSNGAIMNDDYSKLFTPNLIEI